MKPHNFDCNFDQKLLKRSTGASNAFDQARAKESKLERTQAFFEAKKVAYIHMHMYYSNEPKQAQQQVSAPKIQNRTIQEMKLKF